MVGNSYITARLCTDGTSFDQDPALSIWQAGSVACKSFCVNFRPSVQVGIVMHARRLDRILLHAMFQTKMQAIGSRARVETLPEMVPQGRSRTKASGSR